MQRCVIDHAQCEEIKRGSRLFILCRPMEFTVRVLPRRRGRCRHRDGQAAPTLVLIASGARATCFGVCFYFLAGVAFGLLACARVNDSSRASDSTRMTCKRHHFSGKKRWHNLLLSRIHPRPHSVLNQLLVRANLSREGGNTYRSLSPPRVLIVLCVYINGFLDGAKIRCGSRESSTSSVGSAHQSAG